jgi:ABC-type iron transport system FetAB ATPase subunit
LELASLEMSPDNKVVVDDFMDRLSELNKEYKSLNNELNEVGPNEQTIGALIKNLQLRLQLLLKLKEKLHQLKSSENETVSYNNA